MNISWLRETIQTATVMQCATVQIPVTQLSQLAARIMDLEQELRTARCIQCGGEGTVPAIDRPGEMTCPECRPQG